MLLRFGVVCAVVLALWSVPVLSAGTVQGRIENAISGSALNLARVTLKGTESQVFTNEYGEYQLTDVSAGEHELVFSYTGLASQTIKVEVSADGSVTQNVALTSARMTELSKNDDVLTLDAFVVSSQRDTNAASIAANEQRFSSSLKNVVSADAFGDVTEGNVGEFMKYLPGVTVDYVAADVRTMSVRGFADNFTSVSVNGSRMASASSGSGSRSFEFEQVSINNVARIEVSKAPTPSMPADSLGGAVNMVSKNAFERKGAEFKYRVSLNANNEALTMFEKTPGPMGKPTYKVLPGFDFDYTLPVSKTFGLVITGLSSNQYNEQHRSQLTYEFARNGATAANPYLQQYLFQDGPKNTFRDSFSIKADWKITPTQVISASMQTNYYLSQFGNRNFAYNIGTSAATPTSGIPLSYTATSVSGPTGRGTVQGQTSFRDKYGSTLAGNVNWTYKSGPWEVDAALNASRSRTWYRDTGRGHFSEVRTAMTGVNRIEFTDINDIQPLGIKIFNAAGAQLDPTLLSNYTVTFGRGNPLDARDTFVGANLNAKYKLALPFPAAIKVGVDQRTQYRDIRRYDESWNLAAGTTGANYVDQDYLNQDPYWGLPMQQWPDAFLLYEVQQANPSAFAQTVAQQFAAERFRLQNSQYLTEKISAGYVQGEFKFLNSKLGVVTGVRFEKTADTGRGPLTKGALGSTVASVQANLIERAYNTSASYDGYYPSLHLTYEIKDNLLARFSYSTALGRPDFADILPLARVNDTSTLYNDGIGDIPAQTVIVTNTSLEPWSAKSYDASLEYYFPRGGVLSAGGFVKDLSNFWGSTNRTITAQDAIDFNLDSTTVGLQLQSKENVGDAQIKGIELNYQQPLDFLPGIAKDFSVFANATKLNLSGPQNADFNKFIEKSASWGITYSRKPVVLSLKWNYRGRQRLLAQTGTAYGTTAGFREYYAPRTFMDVNAEYKFSKRFSFFANARNVLNVPQILQRYNDVSPEYSRNYRIEEFGIQMSVGLKGSF